jgi:hypothetical protein
VKYLRNAAKVARLAPLWFTVFMKRSLGLDVKSFATPRQSLDQWISAIRKEDLPEVKGKVIIAAFRNKTWIEWSIYCACVIRKMGYESTIIYEGAIIKKLYNNPISFLNFWAGVNRISGVQLVDIEKSPGNEATFKELLDTPPGFVYDSLAYDKHVEKQDILENAEIYKEDLKILKTRIAQTGAVLDKLIKKGDYRAIYCYSGLIDNTPVILEIAARNKLKSFFFEGWSWRAGHIIYNINAPALDFNIQNWLKYYDAIGTDISEEVKDYMDFLNGEPITSEWLKTFYLVQKSKAGPIKDPDIIHFLQKDERPCFLMATNVIGDSATIKSETIFASQKDWMKEMISYFKTNKDKKLIIRAHPAEVWAAGKIIIKLGAFAKQFVTASDENILVIDGANNINTFSLVPYIKCGIPWMSSIGVDLVSRGIPVICAARPKYTGLNIAYEPESKEEYFALIERVVQENIAPDNFRIEAAKSYLYVIFKGFSFPAMGSNYRAMTLKLGQMPQQKEHDLFFGIITGEIEAPDPIIKN